MLLIVSHHYVIHAGFDFSNMPFINTYYLHFLLAGGEIGVDIFVLISAYFMSASTVSIKKIVKLELQVFFYSVIIELIFSLIFPETFSVKQLIKSFFPVMSEKYWFYNVYLLLYILVPFLNSFIEKLERIQHQKLLILLFIVLSVIPSVRKHWGENFYSMLGWFIFLYFSSAYVRKYQSDFSRKSTFYFFIGVIFYFIFISLFLGLDLSITFIFANNFFVACIAASFFLTFLNLNIGNNKAVNLIASATFGVYLLHDNPMFRTFLWKNLFKNTAYQQSNTLIVNSFIAIISVYMGCTLIDLIRRIIFDSLFEKIWETLK